MSESLFTSETPALTDQGDGGTQLTVATAMYAVVAGTITHIRYYSTATPGSAPVLLLYDVTSEAAGALLSSATYSGSLTGGTWLQEALPAGGVHVAANTYFLAAKREDARYVATTGFFTAAGLSNGNLRAIKGDTDPLGLLGGGTLGDGKINVTGSAGYPVTPSGSQACYFVDVVFVADAGDDRTITVAATLGLDSADASTKGSSTSAAASLALAPAETQTGQRTGSAAPTVDLALALSTRNGAGTAGNGGWWSLLGILQEEATARAYYEAQPPMACPNDGEPLLSGPAGGLFCPYDGWRWQG